MQSRLHAQLAETAGGLRVFLTVKTASVAADRRNLELKDVLELDDMLEGGHNMGVSALTFRALARVETRGEGSAVFLEAEEKDLNRRTLSKGFCRDVVVGSRHCLRAVVVALCNALTASLGEGVACAAAAVRLAHLPRNLELLHCLPSLFLVTAQLFNFLSLGDCEARHEALVPLNVGNVQVDLLLKHNKLFVHLNLQIMAACLNLGLHLKHFFFLLESKETSVSHIVVLTV